MMGQMGECKTGYLASISSYGPHFGEESPLSGCKGSGTIFFSGCNLHCVYCQNYDISQNNTGSQLDSQEIAQIMIKLQEFGCHNINLVSPTHVVPQIIESIMIASKMGLHLPIVYNSGGYDSLEMIKLLNNIIDIYMPDMKYADNKSGLRYSKVNNYWQINQAVVKEMHQQVGDLILDSNKIALRGLLIRHLILPNDIAGSKKIIEFIADQISIETYVNIMDQYRPLYKADHFPELRRQIRKDEYMEMIDFALKAGLTRLDKYK